VQNHFQQSSPPYNNYINTIFIKKAIIITTVNWWKRTTAKLLHFQYSHFLTCNSHGCLLLAGGFINVSTPLWKMSS